MKQTRSLSEFSCLSEYTRLYPNKLYVFFQQVTLIVGEPIDVNRTVEEMKRKNASQVG